MKKTKLLPVLIATFLLTLQSFAQKNETPAPLQPQPDFLKHEIGVSVGFFATPIVIPLFYATFPNPNLSYYYNFNKHHAIGVTLSSFFGGIEQVVGLDYSPYDGVILTPQINYRISYGHNLSLLSKKTINLYSVVSLGWKIPIGGTKGGFNDFFFPEGNYFPAVHVTFIGVRVGNQQDAATIEVGYGTHGTIVLGYSHKFKNKAK